MNFKPMSEFKEEFKDGRKMLFVDFDGDIYQLHFSSSWGKFVDVWCEHKFEIQELLGFSEIPDSVYEFSKIQKKKFNEENTIKRIEELRKEISELDDEIEKMADGLDEKIEQQEKLIDDLDRNIKCLKLKS